MTSSQLHALRRDGERLTEEVSRETYLAHSGLKQTVDLQSIYARYGKLLSRDSLALVREVFAAAVANSEERRGARLILDWLADSNVQRDLAELEEREVAWESTATIDVGEGRRIQYQSAAIDIANAPTRAERLAIDEARARLVARELAPLRLERFQRERDLVQALDIAPDYVSTFETLSGIDMAQLSAECQMFLRETESMWADTYAESVKAKLGIALDEATRADALAMMRAREFDRYFPSGDMEEVVRRQVGEMGIDANAGGRILYDTGEREGKRSRAFCSPVRIPDEVYLVLRPHGGQTDYSTFLHELGHALHFAYARADLPFEYRWLGDNSITEAYAMLMDHLLHDPGWLLRYTDLGRHDVAAFLRLAGFEELHFLRRYSAKLLYELDLYSGDVPWTSLPDRYVDLLTNATSFRYDSADAFVDVDARFYSARYLRAWQLQAVLHDELVDRFDADWYRNPRCGPWVVENLFGEGQRELAHELAERVSSGKLSFAPLVRATEAMLVAT
ncbi:MAG: hypothetical protein ABR543_01820 [Gemmatimonadaceae bacterium]